jgi:glycosyltransferase involved in cell wall biosynthesis
MKLSIITPVYNEETSINELLKKVKDVNYGMPFDIIVVNDGSTDGTDRQILKLKNIIKNIKLISYSKNMGKGHAVRMGIKNSDADIIIIQDADLEYNPKQIPNLIRPIIEGKYKVVYGSRFIGQYTGMGFPYLFGNKLLTLMTNFLFKSNLTDMETCYKAIHRDVLNSIQLNQNGFEIEAEITSKILKKRFKIKELPIEYIARNKKTGKKIGWFDGIKNLITLLKIRFNFLY